MAKQYQCQLFAGKINNIQVYDVTFLQLLLYYGYIQIEGPEPWLDILVDSENY